MKPKFLYLTLFSFISINLYSQKIFITENKNEADYIIFYNNQKTNSDWVIMKTTWKNQAKNGIWFFTEWKNEADIKIFITQNKYEADKIVFVTVWSTDIKFDEVKSKRNK